MEAISGPKWKAFEAWCLIFSKQCFINVLCRQMSKNFDISDTVHLGLELRFPTHQNLPESRIMGKSDG
eukprot:scaffold67589_cov15-Prasinocladus_malaysianus.AAC.1